MIEVFQELDKFSHTKFLTEGHLYYINGQNAISATTLIGRCKEAFDSEYWSQRKADEWGTTQEEVLKQWKEKGDFAKNKGNKVHYYIENLLNNKVYPFYGNEYEPMLESWRPIKQAFDKIVPMVNAFRQDIIGKMIPIRSEVVVGDEEFLIGGTIDQIFFNLKSGKLELWDWKTNEKIQEETPYKLKEPVTHLSNAEMHVYSLQLSMYKYIIQKNTDLEMEDCYIAWFNENNPKYKVFKCHDFTEEIKNIIEYHRKAA